MYWVTVMAGTPSSAGQRQVAGDRQDHDRGGCRDPSAIDRCPANQTSAPSRPQKQRHDDDRLGREKIERRQDDQPGEPGAGQIGEIGAVEAGAALQEDDAEEERARQERQQVEDEIGEQPPLLRRVGDDEDGVERHLLARRGWRRRSAARTGTERVAAGALPVPVEPVLDEKMTTLDRPKPSMARLMTSEPKCVQLPTAKTRMTAICRAMTAPATRPTRDVERRAGNPGVRCAGAGLTALRPHRRLDRARSADRRRLGCLTAVMAFRTILPPTSLVKGTKLTIEPW